LALPFDQVHDQNLEIALDRPALAPTHVLELLGDLPDTCPFTVAQLLDDGYWGA
jgi:hypothetical protein